MTTVKFDLPDAPQEFGVQLSSPSLRRLNFSALDFQTLRRAQVEYIRSYFPDIFNDFVTDSGIIMLLELTAYVGNNLSHRSDILVNESFLPTSQSRTAVDQHLQLIDNKIRRQTPATVDVEVSISSATPTAIKIPAASLFQLTGPDNKPVFYEIFRAPNDFTSDIEILPNTRGIVAFGIEGEFAAPFVSVSAGGSNQVVSVVADDILDEPITVTVRTGNSSDIWQRIGILERAAPNDEVYEVQFTEVGLDILFGDDTAGKALLSGQEVTIKYRTGGGIRGRIGAGFINDRRPFPPDPPATAPVEVLFRNISSSSGGTDEETIEEAKRRAPRESAALNAAVTGEDYATLAQNFAHPVFGSVLKASATLRSGVDADLNSLIGQIRALGGTTGSDGFLLTDKEAEDLLLDKFVNRNIVELYVLAVGPNSVPVTPSQGLKQGLKSSFEEINVLTDEVRVLDGVLKAIDLDMTIVVSRSADPSVVKEAVDTAVADFFNIANFDMGEGLFLANLYAAIQAVDGVKFLRLLSPFSDILATRTVNKGTDINTIGINELIVVGSQKLQFFAEPGVVK